MSLLLTAIVVYRVRGTSKNWQPSRGTADPRGTRRSGGRRWLPYVVLAGLVVLSAYGGWLLSSGSLPFSGGGWTRATSGLSSAPAASPSIGPNASDDGLKQIAEQVAEKLYARFPQDARAVDVFARLRFHSGHYGQARALWQECVRLSPEDAAAYWDAAGRVAEHAAEHAEAAQLFRRALEAGSADLQVPVRLAENLMKSGQAAEAIAVLEDHLRGPRFSASALTVLGQAYLDLKQYDRARLTFEAALQADPEDSAAVYGLSMTCARLGDREQARSYMEHFSKLRSAQQETVVDAMREHRDKLDVRQLVLRVLIDSGWCYRANDEPIEAAQLLRSAAEFAPQDIESRARLMTVYEELKLDRAALEIGRELNALDPQNATYWLNVGLLSARVGDLQAGQDAVLRAMELEPDNGYYREVYAAIRRGM